MTAGVAVTAMALTIHRGVNVRDQALRLTALEQRPQPPLGEVGTGVQDPGRRTGPVSR